MEVKLNARGNGACPICVYNGSCKIQVELKGSVLTINKQQSMEVVIYTCPKFTEKA